MHLARTISPFMFWLEWVLPVHASNSRQGLTHISISDRGILVKSIPFCAETQCYLTARDKREMKRAFSLKWKSIELTRTAKGIEQERQSPESGRSLLSTLRIHCGRGVWQMAYELMQM